MDGCKDGWMENEWMDKSEKWLMDGCKDGWMDGWVDG